MSVIIRRPLDPKSSAFVNSSSAAKPAPTIDLDSMAYFSVRLSQIYDKFTKFFVASTHQKALDAYREFKSANEAELKEVFIESTQLIPVNFMRRMLRDAYFGGVVNATNIFDGVTSFNKNNQTIEVRHPYGNLPSEIQDSVISLIRIRGMLAHPQTFVTISDEIEKDLHSKVEKAVEVLKSFSVSKGQYQAKSPKDNSVALIKEFCLKAENEFGSLDLKSNNHAANYQGLVASEYMSVKGQKHVDANKFNDVVEARNRLAHDTTEQSKSSALNRLFGALSKFKPEATLAAIKEIFDRIHFPAGIFSSIGNALNQKLLDLSRIASSATATAAVAVTASTMNPSPIEERVALNKDDKTPAEKAGTGWQTKVGGQAAQTNQTFAEKALASKTGKQIT